MWLWDLSATLGWQQPQPHGAQGSWFRHTASAPWHCDEYFSDWPQQLGAWPCETSLPRCTSRMGAPSSSQGCAQMPLTETS